MTNEAMAAFEIGKAIKFLLLMGLAMTIPLRVFTRHAYEVVQDSRIRMIMTATAVVAFGAVIVSQIATLNNVGSFTPLGELGIWSFLAHIVITNLLGWREKHRTGQAVRP